jgi:quercetin dioxygenase-like cupin family protein
VPIDVYDYRTDVRNVVITPEIRSRFMRMEPGSVAARHSHDLGHEVFLVLEGQAEFEIDGERAVLGPGQMCFARADQMHQVRVVGDMPMTLYLSVTPHIEPTHTRWDGCGRKLPPRYGTATVTERANRPISGRPPAILIDRHEAAAKALAAAAAANNAAQETEAAVLRRAVAAGDTHVAKAAVDAMWQHIYLTYKSVQALEAAWNDLTTFVSESSSRPEE